MKSEDYQVKHKPFQLIRVVNLKENRLEGYYNQKDHTFDDINLKKLEIEVI